MNREENRTYVSFLHATVGISDAVIHIYTYVMLTTLCQAINIFGIVTNCVNIVCFTRQGFKDSIHISLVGLSVSDLGSLVTLFGTCVFITPALSTANVPFECMEIVYLITAMLHFAFTRVSSCITALISLEKCLSIAAPLKVKSIITPRRATAINICIFVVSTFSITPIYVVNRLEWRFSPHRNRTIVRLVSTPNREQVEKITFSINNFAIPLCAFLIVACCTIILSLNLHGKNKWRKKSVSNVQGDRITNRNTKVVKMVVTISTLFIACFIPSAIMMLAVAFEPTLWVTGINLNITVLLAGFSYLLVSINSSVNIFIYYSMSTKYREAFRKISGWFENSTSDELK